MSETNAEIALRSHPVRSVQLHQSNQHLEPPKGGSRAFWGCLPATRTTYTHSPDWRRPVTSVRCGSAYSHVIATTFGIPSTSVLDGCCDHRAMLADEDLHRHAVETRIRPMALLLAG